MAQMPDEKITVSADANVQGRDSETGQVQKIPVGLSAEDLEHALALQRYVPGTAAEKRLVRKLDFILLPVLWLMYVLAYLDRGNIVRYISRLLITISSTNYNPQGKRQRRWTERGSGSKR